MLLVIALLAVQAQGGQVAGAGVVAVEPLTSPAGWLTPGDYPSSVPKDGAGVTIKLAVAMNGKPSDCTVVHSSGYAELDQHACKLMMRRAKFKPPKDAAGNPASGTYLGRFDWYMRQN